MSFYSSKECSTAPPYVGSMCPFAKPTLESPHAVCHPTIHSFNKQWILKIVAIWDRACDSTVILLLKKHYAQLLHPFTQKIIQNKSTQQVQGHFKNTITLHLCSDGDGTHDDSILQHDTEHQEHKVEDEHGEAQHFVHPPFTGSDGNNDEEEHEEEQHDGTEQPITAHGHRGKGMEEREHQPGHRQPVTRTQTF